MKKNVSEVIRAVLSFIFAVCVIILVSLTVNVGYGGKPLPEEWIDTTGANVEVKSDKNEDTSNEVESDKNEDISHEVESDKNEDISHEVESNKNEDTSNEVESDKNEDTSNEVESDKNEDTSNEVESDKNENTSNWVESDKNEDTSNWVESDKNEDTSNWVESDKNEDTSNWVESDKNEDTSNWVESDKNEDTSNWVESDKNEDTSNWVESDKNEDTSNWVESNKNENTSNEVESNKNEKTYIEGSVPANEPAYILSVKNICQYSEPALPTGCEVTALSCWLRYYGFDVSKNIIADKYLPKGNLYYKNNVLCGPDPSTTFIGSPYSVNSFGCYSDCIVITANRYLTSVGSTKKAVNVSGRNMTDLFKYLRNGDPVIVWATMGMSQTVLTTSWKTVNGKNVVWKGNEHCFVLAGYDYGKNIVYVADPMKNTEKLTEYDLNLFMERYNEQGHNAVVIEY